MITSLNPALILILGPLLIPVLQGKVRTVYALLLPIVSFLQLYTLPAGSHAVFEVFDLTLTTLHIDRLSFMFAVIFHIAAFIMTVYSLHLRDPQQQAIGLIYAGCALGVVLAGDLVTLFIYWEAAAISSVFLVWARRTRASCRAGMRYLVIQVVSGFLLLAGIILHAHSSGSIEFTRMDLNSPGAWLIFMAFGIKCAFPLLHNWLVDAYPEATVTGTVVLSAFTTKMAVYALATAFPGTEILVWIGLVMTAFPIFYAVIENDLRRVLTYSMINQLGFMVVGVGIGTELALNGTAAHAFADILFKALLFMSMGAVLLRTGKINGSDLGGLYKSMPYTAGFCIIGAASISAFSTVQRLRDQIDDHGGRGARRHDASLACVAVRLGGCVSPCRNQDPVFRIFCPRQRHPLQGSPDQHAGGNGPGCGPFNVYRNLPADPVRAAAISDGI